MSESADAYLVSWAQITIDGQPAAAVSSLEPGCHLSWSGRPICNLQSAEITGHDLHLALHRTFPKMRFCEGLGAEEPVIGPEMTLTDGLSRYRAMLVELIELARPLLMFKGALPNEWIELRVLTLEEAATPEVAAPAMNPNARIAKRAVRAR